LVQQKLDTSKSASVRDDGRSDEVKETKATGTKVWGVLNVSSGSQCVTKWFHPGDASFTATKAGCPTNDNCPTDPGVNFPSFSGIRAVSMWFNPDVEQDSSSWKFILDFRKGRNYHWGSVCYRNKGMWADPTWTKREFYDSKGNTVTSPQPPPGKWVFLYTEASSGVTNEFSVLRRFGMCCGYPKGLEALGAKLASVMVWSSPLSATDVKGLATGTLPSGAKPMVTYVADDVEMCRKTWADTSGTNSGTIDPGNGMSMGFLAIETGLPSCIHY